MTEIKNIHKRNAGIIVHPTSLPGGMGIGDLGGQAYHFVDQVAKAGLSIWQILPLTPTGEDGCPYNSFSAFAGNELLIDISELQGMGLLPDYYDIPEFNKYRVEYSKVIKFKSGLIKKAAEQFYGQQDRYSEFNTFLSENSWWLDDYTLFKVLTDEFNGHSWKLWPEEFRKRDEKALKEFAKKHEHRIFRYQFGQWIFFSQWKRLKLYANSKGINIMGDIPIFLSYDSADVWANQDIFKMKDGEMEVVSGVPPDYFSETGQLWGNPVYDWDYLKKNDFSWWIDRLKQNLELYDIIRLDHFRGFSASWAVPAGETTAVNGKWKKTPGRQFFNKVFEKLGNFPIIVEDLGDIDKDVKKLRDSFSFAGMKVLQFAFYGGTDQEFLPHNYENTNCVAYTGTHDNDTTLGWYMNLDDRTRSFVDHYLGSDGNEIHWKMIRLVCSSVARTALFPIQDVLGWGSDCRFNVPGTTGSHNWTWRFTEGDIKPYHLERVRGILVAFNRI
jgi:4-alpha-glucanotransferase